MRYDYIGGRMAVILAGMVLPITLAASCAGTAKYPPGSGWAQKGVASLETIRVNGLRHSVLIRGTDRENPLLLFIHAMGIPSMCFAHLEYAQNSSSFLERKFTVIHYDQRGFGKTYLRGKHRKKQVTLDNYVSDAESLVSVIRSRFDNRKIYLLGESWGTQIAARLAARRPDWFCAYIGIGQNVQGCEMLAAANDFCLHEAGMEKNERALKELHRPGPPRESMSDGTLFKSMTVIGKWMDYYLARRYGYESGAGFFFKSLWNAPEYTFIDFEATLTAYIITNKKIIREACFHDLRRDVDKIDIPVYMIMGEYDFWKPIVQTYFDSLTAPRKRLFVIPYAGHMVRGDNPDEVGKILLETVLPETTTDQSAGFGHFGGNGF